MDIQLALDVTMKVVGGLGIFLLGMKNMSEGMQAVAGDRLRKLITAVTNNRIIACAVGTLMTCIVQSSSVTTVMVVGLVNSSFMTLTQAIGVILGANIGTTITGWILVLKIGKYGLPLLGICALVYLFVRKERVRYLAMTLMGIGMVFFGLELMSGGFKPLRAMPEFVNWFTHFEANTYFGVLKCATVGCVLTMIVQSSSATLGITIGLAEAGIIPFHTAAALVLGENIGTTITALLASIGTTTNARRAALSHTIFNVVGVAWITAVFALYMGLVYKVVGHDPTLGVVVDGETTYPFMRKGIAIVHSGFNIINTLLFLPLVPMLARAVTKLIPDKAVKETPHLTYLDVRLLESPVIAIQQSAEEVARMGDHVIEMSDMVRQVLSQPGDVLPDKEVVRKIFHREEIMDTVQHEVTVFVTNLLSGSVPHDTIDAGREQIRMADEFESISDYYAKILKLSIKRQKNGIIFHSASSVAVMALHDRVHEYLSMICEAVHQNRPEIVSKAHTRGEEITHMIKETRDEHLARVGSEGATPLGSLVFTDMLNAYRRVKDHAVNIAEALAGEK